MRVLQVGFGNIGREVFADWAPHFEEYMVVDLVQPIPDGHDWDGGRVDVAVILVDTPTGVAWGDGFDYSALTHAIVEYVKHADFLLIRSTVSLGFLSHPAYEGGYADMIGFSPEFYGATKWSNRQAVTMGFTMMTSNVPPEFVAHIPTLQIVFGTPEEVIVAKLAENAFLATKVTFFHELALMCKQEGIDFEQVRGLTTMDPRIGPDHSFMEEPGWQSHCFDKDVPAFATLGPSDSVVERVIESNRRLLGLRELPLERQVG
jgi:UDP-glucose 6-dehydrogenase